MQFHPSEEHLKAKSNRLCATGDLSENKLTPNNYSNAVKPPQPANARGEAQSYAEIAFFFIMAFILKAKICFLQNKSAAIILVFSHISERKTVKTCK